MRGKKVKRLKQLFYDFIYESKEAQRQLEMGKEKLMWRRFKKQFPKGTPIHYED